jgi:hypothetical protein
LWAVELGRTILPNNPFMSAVERIHTASVLAPLLVLDVICAVLALSATPLIGTQSSWLWVAWAPLLVSFIYTLLAYAYWSVKAPNRLQTENYQLQHQRLLLIGDERDPNNVKIIEGTATSNTAVEGHR